MERGTGLPQGQQPPLEQPPTHAVAPAAGRVLFVDDEPIIVATYGLLLRRSGYDVVTVSTGEKAIAQYREAMDQGTPFDAVIMDLMLPGGLSGTDATKRILESDPSARIIVSSGSSDNQLVTHYRDHGFCGIVPKPYSIESLSAALRAAIP